MDSTGFEAVSDVNPVRKRGERSRSQDPCALKVPAPHSSGHYLSHMHSTDLDEIQTMVDALADLIASSDFKDPVFLRPMNLFMDVLRTELMDARIALDNGDLPGFFHLMNLAVPDTVRNLTAMIHAAGRGCT